MSSDVKENEYFLQYENNKKKFCS